MFYRKKRLKKNAFLYENARKRYESINQSIYRIIKARNPNSGVNQNSCTLSMPHENSAPRKISSAFFSIFRRNLCKSNKEKTFHNGFFKSNLSFSSCDLDTLISNKAFRKLPIRRTISGQFLSLILTFKKLQKITKNSVVKSHIRIPIALTDDNRIGLRRRAQQVGRWRRRPWISFSFPVIILIIVQFITDWSPFFAQKAKNTLLTSRRIIIAPLLPITGRRVPRRQRTRSTTSRGCIPLLEQSRWTGPWKSRRFRLGSLQAIRRNLKGHWGDRRLPTGWNGFHSASNEIGGCKRGPGVGLVGPATAGSHDGVLSRCHGSFGLADAAGFGPTGQAVVEVESGGPEGFTDHGGGILVGDHFAAAVADFGEVAGAAGRTEHGPGIAGGVRVGEGAVFRDVGTEFGLYSPDEDTATNIRKKVSTSDWDGDENEPVTNQSIDQSLINK